VDTFVVVASQEPQEIVYSEMVRVIFNTIKSEDESATENQALSWKPKL